MITMAVLDLCGEHSDRRQPVQRHPPAVRRPHHQELPRQVAGSDAASRLRHRRQSFPRHESPEAVPIDNSVRRVRRRKNRIHQAPPEVLVRELGCPSRSHRTKNPGRQPSPGSFRQRQNHAKQQQLEIRKVHGGPLRQELPRGRRPHLPLSTRKVADLFAARGRAQLPHLLHDDGRKSRSPPKAVVLDKTRRLQRTTLQHPIPSVLTALLQYLKSGCTRYFTSAANEKKLSPSQKSADHVSNGPLRDILLDDVQDFLTLDGALSRLGLSDADRTQIYSTVAAVLHLGNVQFEENPEDTRGGCRVASAATKSLNIASGLLGIDPTELRQALESRVMQSSRGGVKGTVIMYLPLERCCFKK
jgi:hypothetical protein